MAPSANLNSMSIDKLFALRDQIESTLASKVAEERRDLEARLGQLSRFGNGKVRSGGKHPVPRGPVAPKYRNPENPSETWAGRGLTPRWLVAALKRGKKLDHFLIGGVASAAKPAARKQRTFKGSAPARGRASMRGKTVAPKYRNPENPSETWAGRGLKPRWLSDAIKAGKTLEHFAIAARAKRGPTKRSAKASKK